MSHYKITFVPNTENHCWNKAADLIDDESDVLDVGCSTGDFGRALKEYKNCVVDGVEPDRGDAKLASKVLRKVSNKSMEVALDTDLKSTKYDSIVFLDVIEHLVDPVNILKDAKKALKDGGSIIFSIPNMAHISTRLMLLSGNFEYGNTGLLDNTHLHFYTKKEIQRIFNEAGYSVEVWDYTEATYPLSLIRSDLQRLGLKMDKRAEKMLTANSASIFQYVGKAVVTKGKSQVNRVEYSPDPQGKITQYFQGELNKKQSEIDDCNNIIHDLQTKLSDEKYLVSRISLKRHIRHFIETKLK